MFPVTLLFLWLINLLSLAIIGGGGYLLWEWYEGDINARWPLYTGIGLLTLALLGRPLLLPLLGRSPDPGEEDPQFVRSEETRTVARPDGTELFVELAGPQDAPVLVLTHGWGMNAMEWYYAKKHLSDRFRLVMWDLPGLGNSKGPRDNDYTVDKMARDLEAVLSVAEDRPVLLCGHSIGGMITLKFCELFPEQLGTRVVGLALHHTTYTNPVRTAAGGKFWRALQEPLLKPLCHLTIWTSPLSRLMNLLSYMNGSMHVMNHLTQYGRSETRGKLDFATRFNIMASPAVSARGMLGMMKYDAEKVLETLQVPTLVVLGEDDVVTVPEANLHIASRIPGARTVKLNPGGHLGLIEKHPFWLNELENFAEKAFAGQVGPRKTPQGQQSSPGKNRKAFGG